MIHVCFGLHDGDGHYSKFVGTTMASMFENVTYPPPSLAVHILHDATLTDDNREKFSWLVGRYNQRVEFHNVDELCPEEIAYLREKLADKIRSRFSVGAFYRLLVKKLFGSGRMIYLDADIIVNMDIAEMWRADMKNFPVASVPEIDATHGRMITNKFLINAGLVRTEDYFCSGVTMFNLDAIYDSLFTDGVNFLSTYPQCESVDQDILNAFFSKNYLKLEQKFDSFVLAEKPPVAPKIYHYAGNGLGLNTSDAFDRLWLEYFSRTPWFDVDAIGNLAEEFRKTADNFALNIQMFMKACVERRRAFFVNPRNLEVMRLIFAVRDDELIVEERDENSLNELLSKMTEFREQRTFVIVHENYAAISAILHQRGFVENQDFVDGLKFMARAQCGQTPPEYHFIRAI